MLRVLSRSCRPFVRRATASTGTAIENLVLTFVAAAGTVQFIRVYWLRSEWFRTAPAEIKFYVQLAAFPPPGLMHMGTEFLALLSLYAIAGVGMWILPLSNRKYPAHLRFAYSSLLVAAGVSWGVWVRESLFFSPIVYWGVFSGPGQPVPATPVLPAVLTTFGILAALIFAYLAATAKGAVHQPSMPSEG